MNKKIVINMVLMLAFIAVSIFTSPQISFAKNDHEHGHDESNHNEEKEKEGDQGNHEEESSTTISEESAKNAGIKISQAKPQIIFETISLTGKIILDQDRAYNIKARFPGVVKDVKVKWGQKVKKGQVLAVIESNDSLKLYSVKSPRSGIVLKRNTNVGNVAGDESIFTIADLSKVWAEFHVFPRDIHDIKEGQEVVVRTLENGTKDQGKISLILPTADAESQTVIAIVSLENKTSKWKPGMSVEGKVKILEKEVPIAVNKKAIQKIEGESVIFVKEGSDKYEARHVKLGKGDDEYIEVIEGLNAGEEYVSHGSFIIKADILKSTAEHSH
ncbi:efflux RND transporter periplasmic adaptor subunit [Rickettsiales bacterium]|nr:efflux RND transporter periplasmic adaptor subunit [Rickettsiales bacterium]